MTINPIETWYAGCRFRSRLEARWAVFFDHLGIRWMHEAQGYKLPSGVRYLPDFALPELDILIEVKGDEATFRNEAPQYAEAVQTRSVPGIGMIFLGPIPDATTRYPLHLAVAAEPHCCGETVLSLRAIDFALLTPQAGYLGYSTDRRSHDPLRLPALGHLGRDYAGYIGGGFYPPEWPLNATLSAAYLAARSARFEHGEQPAPPPKLAAEVEWPPVAEPGSGAVA
jgi:hypothetical protein